MQKLFIFWKLNFSASKLESENLLHERINHTTTNDDFVSNINHLADQFQLIIYFGTSQNCEYWFFRFFDKSTKVLNLLLH